MKPTTLTIAIAAGIVFGFIGQTVLSDYLYRKRTDAFVQVATEITNQASQRLQTNVEAGTRQAQEQRAVSPRGKDLERRCLEFRNAYASNGGHYAREQRDLACRRYEEFVRSGRVLP